MPNTVELEQQADYGFSVRFAPGVPALHADEPPPLGKGAGPSPTQLLAAAVGNCLAASLVFALRKFRIAAEPISATAEPTVRRNDKGRLRVQGIRIQLRLGVPAASLQNLDRALAQFEDFCTVTQSVRPAFPVEVEVYDGGGQRLK